MGTVNVGIIGVGNRASALVQGIEYYADTRHGAVGLTNAVCAGYAIADVRFKSAFDVNASKVGVDLSQAIAIAPNSACRFANVPVLGVPVTEGIGSEGFDASVASRTYARGGASLDDIVRELRRTDTRVVVNLLPVGSQRASELYAEAAIEAGCAFVNCIPAVIARSADWARRFENAGLPLIGDDLKSQFGSTLIHRALLDVLRSNGLTLRNTYQIVSGGDMDFLNLQDAERVQSTRKTKIEGLVGNQFPEAPAQLSAEYVPLLADRKIAFIRVEAEAFGGTTFELELRMSVEDSPSAAGNVLDAVRYMQFALDRGVSGVVDSVASLLMKAPPPLRQIAASPAGH